MKKMSEVKEDAKKRNFAKSSKKKKSKKPIIKKSKLDLKKLQKARNSLKKSNVSITSSNVINNQIPTQDKNLTRGLLGNQKKTSGQIWPNKKTFENFLKSNKTKFLKKDTIFLLRDLGAFNDCLYEDRFKRFIFSNVWES
jgi:hypothetical protein